MIVALDIGSTNSRAWLIDLDGQAGSVPTVHARTTESVGVRDAALARSNAPVHDAVRRLIADLSRTAAPSLIAGAGMITSPLGLREVPHLPAPAGLADLAAHVVRFDDERIAPASIVLVPGVRTNGASTLDTDVMRGEETLVLGLLATGLASPGTGVLNAGSHWKLIQIDAAGRVASSRTTLGGEVVHAIATSTLLASAVPPGPPRDLDEEWLVKGADATAAHGVLRAMFGVRLLQLANAATPEARHAFLIGATIAADVQALVTTGALAAGQTLLVTGPAAMASAWVRLLASENVHARALSADELESAFLAGIAAIARSAA